MIIDLTDCDWKQPPRVHPSLFGPAVRFIREKQAAGYSEDQILAAWMLQPVEDGR
jgi:hypothetical protein